MIDERAIIDPRAQIADGVSIGPWSSIGPDVEIGPGCRIASHVVIKGPTRIGAHNQIFQFSSIGEDCQDKKYAGERTFLEIGDHNIFRESCTVHRGTAQDQSITRIGNHNLFMVNAHIAHDCQLGDHIILANNVALAGHVKVGDYAILGGFTAVHQFCQIGSHVMCGAGTVLLKDLPDYVMANGNPAKPHGINVEGLKRRGFDGDVIRAIRMAYKVIYRQQLKVDQAIEALTEMARTVPQLTPLLISLQQSTRGIVR